LTAILTISLFLPSCSQDSIEEVTPITVEDEALLRTILSASKGKLIKNVDTYSISLSKEDLGTKIYEAITNRQTLDIGQNFTISAEDTKDIFCLSKGECLVKGNYTLEHQDIAMTSFDNLEERGCICFCVNIGFVCVRFCIC